MLFFQLFISECGSGYYRDRSNETCKLCPLGTYSETSVDECTACPLGYTSSEEGLTSRSQCHIGLFRLTYMNINVLDTFLFCCLMLHLIF